MIDNQAGMLGAPITSYFVEGNLEGLLNAYDLPCHPFHSCRPCRSFHSLDYYDKGVELLSIFLHTAAAFINTYYSDGEVEDNTLAGLHSEALGPWEDSHLDISHNSDPFDLRKAFS